MRSLALVASAEKWLFRSSLLSACGKCTHNRKQRNTIKKDTASEIHNDEKHCTVSQQIYFNSRSH